MKDVSKNKYLYFSVFHWNSLSGRTNLFPNGTHKFNIPTCHAEIEILWCCDAKQWRSRRMKNKEQNPYKAACWREKARCCAISPLTQAGLINYRSNCRGTWVVCINNFMKSFWKRTTCPLRRVFVLAHALVFFLSQYCSDAASNLNSWNHPHKILFLFLFFEGLTMVIVWINPTWLAHNPCTTCTCGSDKSRKKSLNKTFWSENLCKLSTLGEWMLVRKLIKKNEKSFDCCWNGWRSLSHLRS